MLTMTTGCHCNPPEFYLELINRVTSRDDYPSSPLVKKAVRDVDFVLPITQSLMLDEFFNRHKQWREENENDNRKEKKSRRKGKSK